MKIYTVIMSRESFSKPPILEVFGSFTTGSKAKKILIDKIIEWVQDDSEFADTIWTDENHPDIVEEIGLQNEGFFEREEKKQKLPKDVYASLFNYLNQEIGNEEGSYHVYSATAFDRDATYMFDVVKNELDKE